MGAAASLIHLLNTGSMSQMPLPTDAALSQKPISSDVATASHAETDRKNEHVIETSYNDKEVLQLRLH